MQPPRSLRVKPSVLSPLPVLGGLHLNAAEPQACHPISNSRSLERRKKPGAPGKGAGWERAAAMKKLLDDIKRTVLAVTAQPSAKGD